MSVLVKCNVKLILDTAQKTGNYLTRVFEHEILKYLRWNMPHFSISEAYYIMHIIYFLCLVNFFSYVCFLSWDAPVSASESGELEDEDRPVSSETSFLWQDEVNHDCNTWYLANWSVFCLVPLTADWPMESPWTWLIATEFMHLLMWRVIIKSGMEYHESMWITDYQVINYWIYHFSSVNSWMIMNVPLL